MKFKKAAPRLEDVERDDVHLVVNRCPFCHTNVAHDEAEVVCKGCLARHHTSCWDESHVCSACGHGTRLAPDTSTPQREQSAPWLVLFCGVVIALLLGLATFDNRELRAEAQAAVGRQSVADTNEQMDELIDSLTLLVGVKVIRELGEDPSAPKALARLEAFKVNCAKLIADKGTQDLKPKELRRLQRGLDTLAPAVQLRVVQTVLGWDDAQWAERLGVTELDLIRYDKGVAVPSRCTLVAGLMLRDWYTTVRTGL